MVPYLHQFSAVVQKMHLFCVKTIMAELHLLMVPFGTSFETTSAPKHQKSIIFNALLELFWGKFKTNKFLLGSNDAGLNNCISIFIRLD